MSPLWLVFWGTTAIKLLLIPFYYSTDFDVHRNWLAITHTLPIEQWYTENTSEWTLDYPPLFAWFEYALSQFAGWFDPAMLTIQRHPYTSPGTVLFQRLTVIITDIVLFAAIQFYCYADKDEEDAAAAAAASKRSPPAPLLSSASAPSSPVLVSNLFVTPTGSGSGGGTSGGAVSHPSSPASYPPPRPPTPTGGVQLPTPQAFQARRTLTIVLLTFTNPGLLMVDHIHFQYNGILLGVFILSIALIRRGDDLLAGIVFAILMNMKHIFLYVAPVYFIYILAHYCYQPVQTSFTGWEQFERGSTQRSFSFVNLIKMGVAVVLVFAVSLGPFIAVDRFGAILGRLFPVGERGLCHAYWAPNIWAIYNTADRVFITCWRMLTGTRSAAAAAAAAASSAGAGVAGAVAGAAPVVGGASLTGGLVHAAASYAVLPNVGLKTTLVLAVLSMTPALIRLWRVPHPRLFLSALIYCSFCSFMTGYHVHEKAVLMTIIPLSLCAVTSFHSSKTFLFVSVIGHYSLFPLLFRSQETPIKFTLFILFTLVAYVMLAQHKHWLYTTTRIRVPHFFNSIETAYLWGFGIVQLFVSVIHPLLLADQPRFAFMPLLVTSVYCAVGMVYGWYLCYQFHVQQTHVIESF